MRWRIAASLAAIAFVVLMAWTYTRPASYATGIGEQRSIALADGSRIELNSRSRLQVRFSKQERRIDLMEGQALFNVAKDPVRPFVVESGATSVRAVGTEFDVYRKESGTIVTVIEGRVEVDSASRKLQLQPPSMTAGAGNVPEITPQRMQLAAGEQAVIAADRVARTPEPNVKAATAWTQRRLIFDSASLAEVASEFNRYNFQQLVIGDPEVATFPVSGVFSASDPSSLVRFLEEQPEIAVERTDTQVIIRRKFR